MHRGYTKVVVGDICMRNILDDSLQSYCLRVLSAGYEKSFVKQRKLDISDLQNPVCKASI